MLGCILLCYDKLLYTGSGFVYVASLITATHDGHSKHNVMYSLWVMNILQCRTKSFVITNIFAVSVINIFAV